MSTTERPQKISIGFHGGQVLAARVKPAELTRLRGALGGTGWHDLAGEDGTIVLDLARIDYLLLDDEDHRVGF
jgi:FAD/FMN-containing dehydrogenase